MKKPLPSLPQAAAPLVDLEVLPSPAWFHYQPSNNRLADPDIWLMMVSHTTWPDDSCRSTTWRTSSFTNFSHHIPFWHGNEEMTLDLQLRQYHSTCCDTQGPSVDYYSGTVCGLLHSSTITFHMGPWMETLGPPHTKATLSKTHWWTGREGLYNHVHKFWTL